MPCPQISKMNSKWNYFGCNLPPIQDPEPEPEPQPEGLTDYVSDNIHALPPIYVNENLPREAEIRTTIPDVDISYAANKLPPIYVNENSPREENITRGTVPHGIVYASNGNK